jgi:hypothetical protein
MAEPTPAAVTPAAATPIEGGTKLTATQTTEPEKKTLTQAEIDAIVEDRLKRDREAREKDLGMTHKEAKAIIAARKKAEEDEKTALEKANEKASELEKAIKARDLRDLKRSKVEAMIAEKKIKLPDGVSISDVLETVTGEDEDGINKSLGRLLKFFPYDKSMGTGSNPANAGSKTANIDEQIAEAEAKAAKDPKFWNLVTQLKIEKQRQIKY